jgi:hypothetical protein
LDKVLIITVIDNLVMLKLEQRLGSQIKEEIGNTVKFPTLQYLNMDILLGGLITFQATVVFPCKDVSLAKDKY